MSDFLSWTLKIIKEEVTHLQDIYRQTSITDALVYLFYSSMALELFRMILVRLSWMNRYVLLPFFRGLRIFVSDLVQLLRSRHEPHPPRPMICDRCGDEISLTRVSAREHLLDRSKRLSFTSGTPIVYGWPSSGGVLVKTVSGAEIDWLGLSRVEETQRLHDKDEENVFCHQLRKLGAKWYSHQNLFMREGSVGYELNDGEVLTSSVEVGFPNAGSDLGDGGAWVLRVPPTGVEAKRQRCLLSLVRSMEERCQVIRDLGGRYFESADAVPGFTTLADYEDDIDLRRLQAEMRCDLSG